jgi:hypothetical protein
MDDDCFIGKPLKKSDFFYVENGKVVPSIVAKIFEKETQFSSNKKHIFYKLKAQKNKEQSGFFFMYSVYTTYLFIIKLLKKNLIVPFFTHNAIPCNLKDLKEIYELVYKSKYKFYTLDSLKRHFESLQFQTFYMSYTFNKYNKKVHPLSYHYIDNNNAVNENYNFSLFCINTGNEDYSNLSFKLTKVVMENLFPEPTKYELLNHIDFQSIELDTISQMKKNKIKKNEEIKYCLEKLKEQLKLFLILIIIFIN